MTSQDAKATIMESLRQTGNLRTVYTVQQAAAALGQSRSVTYELVNKGAIPSNQIGGHRKITITMLLDYLIERDETARRSK